MNEKVLISKEHEWAPRGDPFDTYAPPFDLEADMLFAMTSIPTGPLANHFDMIQFLGVGGATPLILWFSRIRSLVYGPAGSRERLDETTGFGYNELNVVALLRGRRLFVPVIHADGDLTQVLGHRYGMPKRHTQMTFAGTSAGLKSRVMLTSGTSEVQAKLIASGRILGRVVDLFTPWWTWPAQFPDGSFIRAQIQRVPRAQLASVSGELVLDEPWLPEPAALRPLGLFVPGLAMQLPAPRRERTVSRAS
jgi:hypothetical protein